jgi:hypothetical protein
VYVQNNPVVYTDPSGKISVLGAIGLAGLYGACANVGWYGGDLLATYVKTGENRFSAATLGGRAAGGFAAGASAATVLVVGASNPVSAPISPFIAGSVAGGAGYYADRKTQEVLSNMGLGSAQPYIEKDFYTSIALGAPSGGIAVGLGNSITPSVASIAKNNIMPNSWSNEITQKELTGLMRSGVINTVYKDSMATMNAGYSNKLC